MLEEGPNSFFGDFEPENLGARTILSGKNFRNSELGVLEAYHNVGQDHEVNINMQISGHGVGGY